MLVVQHGTYGRNVSGTACKPFTEPRSDNQACVGGGLILGLFLPNNNGSSKLFGQGLHCLTFCPCVVLAGTSDPGFKSFLVWKEHLEPGGMFADVRARLCSQPRPLSSRVIDGWLLIMIFLEKRSNSEQAISGATLVPMSPTEFVHGMGRVAWFRDLGLLWWALFNFSRAWRLL